MGLTSISADGSALNDFRLRNGGKSDGRQQHYCTFGSGCDGGSSDAGYITANVIRQDFPSFKVGGRTLISVDGLRDWVQRQLNEQSVITPTT